MPKSNSFLIGLLLILACAGCRGAGETPAAAPVLEPRPSLIVISEVLAGMEGNNQADFIELYNAGIEIADLEGHSLWYQLNDSTEEILVIRWDQTSLIPPLGYYALALEGQEFSVLPDAVFSQPLVPNRGGLSLRKGDLVLDQLSWGTGPAAMAGNSPAPAMVPGSSLARALDLTATQEYGQLPDFQLNSASRLDNTGSPGNHPSSAGLGFTLSLPPVIQPGSTFSADLTVQNQTGLVLQNLKIHLPLPDEIGLVEDGTEISQSGNLLTYTLPTLEAGQTFTATIPLKADFTLAEYSVKNSYLKAENWPLPSFNGPIYGIIGGGPIPIAIARTLLDKEVIVEGISTMYVGGFYAGSGAKFYLEDDTGGIQVYLAGAGSSLSVPLGATVRVRGKVEIYRDSLELVPASEDSVQIIASPEDSAERLPAITTIEDINTWPDAFPGKLVEVEGRVARIEEFSYSFEIDLFDDIGNQVSLYIDKNTGITLEEIEPDQFFRAAGIMELYDGSLQLYPRLQSDLSRIYPPGLSIQVQSPTTAQPQDTFPVTYTVTNYSPDPDQNLIISAPVDPQLEVLEIDRGGRIEANSITWEIPALGGNGAETAVSYTARMREKPEFVSFRDYSVVSPAWPDPTSGITSYTFSGLTVPIWAIQGSGSRSPYILSQVISEGTVTGVFPELEGFWIQEIVSDTDPSTSPGIFINAGNNLPDLEAGDLVSVKGRVRESFQQTLLEISSPSNITVLGKTSLPVPVILDPPAGNQASAAYYEALEGALVTVPGPALVVGPTTAYGEFALVLPRHGVSRAWQDGDHGLLIHGDDGSSIIHEYRDGLPAVVAVGDTVYGLTGPLAYTYGNYKIEPTKEYRVVNQPPLVKAIPALEQGYFSLMTWNVANLFDFVVPHPSSPPLPRVSEYKQDISKVAQTIMAAGFPTVIGLQEVENLEILEDIASDPLLLDYRYQAYLIEGTDSRGIDVGYLVNGDLAEVLSLAQYPAPGNITSRPPLLVEIALPGSPDASLYVLNNHFTSMSGGELATEPRRSAQAAWNLEIALGLLKEDPTAYLAILGDLNSYYGSLPLRTIQEGGFHSGFDYLEPEQRYNYVYQGLSQVLDHILFNDSLESLLVRVDILHSNADYPLPSSTEEGFIHKSDHDPVLATFILP